ncbi:neurogenic locus Notch protein-like [Saccostrea echinata]|uniref:neurogenic locus Notch protein-like n=1 Tax=Saccostrea echinata TaxID=191078 RepID=UPI002A7F0B02|nr:neurogenic locus Notch protein-like [Saccostrea echinata]
MTNDKGKAVPSFLIQNSCCLGKGVLGDGLFVWWKRGIQVSQCSDREGLPATKAVDGNYSQNYQACAHTAPYQSKAWFQVDLRTPYRLNSVKIFYRNETNWRPYRFRQFYLDVSNTSAALSATLTPQSSRVRCYKDNTTYPATPPSVIDIPCRQTAQYVIIETTYNASENTEETGPMLEICEIDIYGCHTRCFGDTCYSNGECDTCGGGHWGQRCQYSCSSRCYIGSCDKHNGTCNRGCQRGFWGNNCTKNCSGHCLNDICDYDNGTCIGGCKTYFTGTMCQNCLPTRYGGDCEMSCSTNCLNETCHADNGTCTFGCDGNQVDAKCLQCNDN